MSIADRRKAAKPQRDFNRPLDIDRLENFNIIEAVYIGAGNTTPARVKLYAPRFKSTKFISAETDKNYNDIRGAAIEYLNSKGIDIIGSAMAKKGFILISRDFKNIK